MRRMIQSTTSGFSTMGITRDLSVRTDAKREPGANLVPNAEEVVAMIPQITQIEPDSLEQYWCGKCGTELPNPELSNCEDRKPMWRFCPTCGEPIRYDMAKPVQWSEQNCEKCGRLMIWQVQNIPWPYFMTSSDYVGGPICRTCLEAHCVQTDCAQCEIGRQPDCPYNWIKQCALDCESGTNLCPGVF